MRANILSFLDDYSRRGDEIVFAHKEGLRVVEWSYARVAEVARRFARELEARGVQKGMRVLLSAENSPEWVAAFFGCALRGAVVVPLDAGSAPDFLARVREQTRPVLLIHDGHGQPEALADLSAVSLASLEETVRHHDGDAYRAEEIGAGDLLEIIYTSGTTSAPKGVLLTHGNLLASIGPLEGEIEKYLKWERLVHPLRFLNSLPLSHVFGQLMSIFVPQLLGARVFFQLSLTPSEIIETARRERINVLVTIPRVLEILRDRVISELEREGKAARFERAFKRAEGRSVMRRLWAFRSLHKKFGWRFWAFISGGATLAEETEEFWQRTGFAVIQGYGMTETASLISVNHPFKKSRGSIGRTLAGQEVRLDASGEIMVRGANVSPGYWAGSGADSHARTEEGWLRTGDVGAMDEAGNLYFKGRKKDVIVTAAGLNIYPEDLEAALNAQPEVRESVVISFESGRGPEPLAVVIMRDKESRVDEAVARANRRLAKHQQIRRHFLWPEMDFPRTATQKIIKREVMERVKASLSSSPEPAESSAVAEVISRIGAVGRAREMTLASGLERDLNLDSLGRVELLSALEERYQVELDEAAFTNATTVGDVEKMVRQGGLSEAPAAQYPYPEWARSFPVTWLRRLALYLFILPLTYVLCRVRTVGLENLKALRGPLLFVSNHISMVDHALIIEALPGRFRRHLAIAMEGEILRDWVHPRVHTSRFTRLRWLGQYALVLTFFNVFPLPKKSGFRRSFTYAGEMMDRGQSILVFPEGTRSDDGSFNPFMTGTGLLAAQLGAAVVPVRIKGLAELKREGKHFARPGQVSVIFGKAVNFSRGADPAEIARELERRVREL
ncbi:MAG TPA: AMP-binding protein [Pyrinomonadaceae bacterium]|nr:AMP-binding protein [Pyrinomonadaceae bacterium]